MKKYHKQTSKQPAPTIKSGVQSGDSDRELLIIEPLIEHPQIKGLYRAVDHHVGENKWYGWVEYTPPAPPPVQNNPVKERYREVITQLRTLKEPLALGVITEKEVEVLRKEAKQLLTQLGIL